MIFENKSLDVSPTGTLSLTLYFIYSNSDIANY